MGDNIYWESFVHAGFHEICPDKMHITSPIMLPVPKEDDETRVIAKMPGNKPQIVSIKSSLLFIHELNVFNSYTLGNITDRSVT